MIVRSVFTVSCHHAVRLWRSPRRWSSDEPRVDSLEISRFLPSLWGKMASLIRRNRWEERFFWLFLLSSVRISSTSSSVTHSLMSTLISYTCAIRKLPYVTMDTDNTNIYLMQEMIHGEDTPTNKVYRRACGWGQRRMTSRIWHMFIHNSRKLVNDSAPPLVFSIKRVLRKTVETWKMET